MRTHLRMRTRVFVTRPGFCTLCLINSHELISIIVLLHKPPCPVNMIAVTGLLFPASVDANTCTVYGTNNSVKH